VIYLVTVSERVISTLEVEADNKARAISKARNGDYIDRDDWDRELISIDAVVRQDSSRA
jgi:hypothetical protein